MMRLLNCIYRRIKRLDKFQDRVNEKISKLIRLNNNLPELSGKLVVWMK